MNSIDEPCYYADTRLLQFAKAPVPAKVKTRLVPALGAATACELHCRLVKHQLQQMVESQLAPVELWIDDVDNTEALAWSNEFNVPVFQQTGYDLGARMHHALESCTANGKQAVLTGSDCPAIDRPYLQEAIEALHAGVNVVLGPALDGGYVLIGVRSAHAGLFSKVEWGTKSVLQQTLGNIQRLGLSYHLLGEKPDIDRPADLALLADYGLPDFQF